MSKVEDVARRLAAIQDELLALPAGPSKRRYELLQERDALRDTAAEFAEQGDEDRSSEDLKAELDALRRKRRSLVDSRSGYVMGKGGDNAGPASAAWVRLSGLSRVASELDHLNIRIPRLEDVLASRPDGGDDSG